MSAPRGFRFAQQSVRNTSFYTQFRSAFQRRAQTTAANPAAEAPKQSTFQRLWTSEVGIKTVHFWAPVMKWGVVISGAADFFRPAEKLSLSQNAALVATGSIWTRWCFVIRPQNMLLAGVNFCLFIVGTIQTTRILLWRASQKGSVEDAAKDMGHEIVEDGKRAEAKVKEELK